MRQRRQGSNGMTRQEESRARPASPPRFRVWILHCEPWKPRHWDDVPPRAIALEPAEAGCFSAREARDYVEGFNTSPERPPRLWAMRVPIRWQVDVELRPGAVLDSRRRASGRAAKRTA